MEEDKKITRYVPVMKMNRSNEEGELRGLVLESMEEVMMRERENVYRGGVV